MAHVLYKDVDLIIDSEKYKKNIEDLTEN